MVTKDLAMAHVSPNITNEQDNWDGDMDQTSIAPAGHSNIEGIISDIISSNFPQDEHRILVYEYMARGSLENQLFKKYSAAMPWSTRMKFALGEAKGLAFLHEADKPVIYRDFKASNFLLDSVLKDEERRKTV